MKAEEFYSLVLSYVQSCQFQVGEFSPRDGSDTLLGLSVGFRGGGLIKVRFGLDTDLATNVILHEFAHVQPEIVALRPGDKREATCQTVANLIALVFGRPPAERLPIERVAFDPRAVEVVTPRLVRALRMYELEGEK